MAASIFQSHIKSMTEAELLAYSNRCETTPTYIINHLLNGYKVPRRKLMAALVIESNGKLSRDDLLDHFYPQALFQRQLAA